MPGSRRLGPTVLAATVAAVLSAAPAFAHLNATVGSYDTVVGWLGEPAIQGQMNGLDITVLTSPADQPVTGLEDTLKADVLYGSAKETLGLSPQEGKPGHYEAPIAPSQAGDYKVRLYGTIEGTAFDHTYDLGSDPDMVVAAFSSVAFPSATAPSGTAPVGSSATAPTGATMPTTTPAATPSTGSPRAWEVWLALVLGAVGTVTGILGLASGGRRGSA